MGAECPVIVYIDTGIDPVNISLLGYAVIDGIDMAYSVLSFLLIIN